MFLPDILLKRAIRKGRLTLIAPDGEQHSYGDAAAGPSATVRFTDESAMKAVLRDPALRLGEAYMDGTFVVEQGDLFDFLYIVTINKIRHWSLDALKRFRLALRGFHQRNPVTRARQNVAHHYDLSAGLYDLFLDSDRQYSCAYWRDADDDLEAAQYKKRVHIASKLRLEPGKSVLDIGCGWGGMALHLGEATGADVHGITLSEEQLAIARRRADEAGAADRVRFDLQDYRALEGQYDRIVSVGMFEHVGVPNYPAFFGKVAELLDDDGVALIHSIGRCNGPGSTNPWLEKYIFPGGYVPALSEVVPHVERAGLMIADIEILRLHYAKTCRAWRERFMARKEEAAALYDERFVRMWEWYLAGAEIAFANGGQMVFQMQLAKKVDALPITRDYMIDEERAALAQPRT